MKIPDFTIPEIEQIKSMANFTKSEETLFDLRNSEHSIEECAEIMHVSKSTIDRLNRKMKDKIWKVI